MSRLTIATLAAACLLALPTVAAAHERHYDRDDATATAPVRAVPIRISCFRGPWREIIWDHANPSFTDDLVAYGYSYSEAWAIANRICQDPRGVDNSQYLVDVTQDILRTHPPS